MWEYYCEGANSAVWDQNPPSPPVTVHRSIWPLGWGIITRRQTGGRSLVCAKAFQTWDINWEPLSDTTCESIVGHQRHLGLVVWLELDRSGPQFLQGELDCQKLYVAYMIIPLCRRQLMGEKSAWMDFIVRRRVLGKYCTYTCIWSKRSHNEMKCEGASGDKGR